MKETERKMKEILDRPDVKKARKKAVMEALEDWFLFGEVKVPKPPKENKKDKS